MKYLIIAGIALSVVAFTNSSSVKSYHTFLVHNNDTTKPSKQNKTQSLFDAFPDYVDTDTAKITFVKEFNKGRIIYKQTCAKCHNVTKDGKLYYPDFSIPQLIDYEMRFQYPAHQDELKETNLSPLELDWVVIFLQYKKKNLLLNAK